MKLGELADALEDLRLANEAVGEARLNLLHGGSITTMALKAEAYRDRKADVQQLRNREIRVEGGTIVIED